MASSWPPIDAPPPEGVVRRIVFETSSGIVLEDEDTIGWTREDWHMPPESPAGPCQVLYLYDPATTNPRGTPIFPEDEQPFAGLPRRIYREPEPSPLPEGLFGLAQAVSAPDTPSEPPPLDDSSDEEDDYDSSDGTAAGAISWHSSSVATSI